MTPRHSATVPTSTLRAARLGAAGVAAALLLLDGILVALPASVVTVSVQLMVSLGLFGLAALAASAVATALLPPPVAGDAPAGSVAASSADTYAVYEQYGWYVVVDERGAQVAYCPTWELAMALATRLGRVAEAPPSFPQSAAHPPSPDEHNGTAATQPPGQDHTSPPVG